MGKLPAFQFYTGDWLKDPALSMCSPATRGIWIDFLCAAHESARSGQITGTPDQFARVCRCTAAEFVAAVNELQTTGAALIRERDGMYTLTNRRMKREADEREGARLRKQRERGGTANSHADVTDRQRLPIEPDSGVNAASSQESHANVTPYSSSSSSSSSSDERDARATDVLMVYGQYFDQSLSIYQQEQLTVIADLEVWRATLVEWKTNGYSKRNIAGMIRMYKELLVKPAAKGARNGATRLSAGATALIEYLGSDEE